MGTKWKLRPGKVSDLPKLVQEEMITLTSNPGIPTPNPHFCSFIVFHYSFDKSSSWVSYLPGAMARVGKSAELTEKAMNLF